MSKPESWVNDVINRSTPQEIFNAWVEDSLEVDEYVGKLQDEIDRLTRELAELKAKLPKYADTGETFIPWNEPYFFYLTVSDTVQSPIDPENAFLIAWDDGFWNEFMYHNRAAAEQAAREAEKGKK